MTRPDDPLQRLLEAHFENESEDSCARAGQLDRWLGGDRSPAVRAAVAAHIETCAICRQVFETANAADVAGIDLTMPAWDASAQMPPLARRPAVRPRRTWPWALAASALIAAGVAVATMQGDAGLRPKGGTSGVSAPTSDDALMVALTRGDIEVRAASGDRLDPGDRLAFYYTAGSAGYLQIHDLAVGTAPSRLFPISSDGAIEAGIERALHVGAEVGPGVGCEWLVATFSESRLEAAAVEAALTRARLDSTSCVIELEMPGARTVVTLAFRR